MSPKKQKKPSRPSLDGLRLTSLLYTLPEIVPDVNGFRARLRQGTGSGGFGHRKPEREPGKIKGRSRTSPGIASGLPGMKCVEALTEPPT
ncbi:hypothetical protein TRIP_B50331 [uncultured Desulfatiglans sp.]|uniref:Uncharacterized protein n=1 Tax=Uncultured Desulfatiglans sp. TaxID=1748965 RepID=A0A653AHJ1_UNCDX|nr:hypothetical protein TRIP_B50331 [uncultured Desulfatiglans sp.]